MGKLEEFLLSNTVETTEEMDVYIHPFPHPFKIRAITEGENKEIRKSCQKTIFDKKTHQKQTETDTDLYMNRLVIACTVEPNFKSAELQAKYGVMGAEALVDKMLKPGQFSELLQAVQEINGFDSDINEMVEEAKN